jgi:predicted regulator of Ras-like GTPase activity (Roadblock/LC7/MglB family)
MPKAQQKGKLEEIPPEDLSTTVEDLKPRESKPQTTLIKSKPKEIPPEKVRAILDEMRKKEGINGYILRNTRAASIDLNDPARLVDYAILSSSAKEAGQELSQTFDLGEIESMLLEGKNTKLLSLAIGENDISVLMEKTVDHNKIYQIARALISVI